MNNRAAFVDQWRLIALNANRLEAVLDVQLDGDIGTFGDNPFRFNADTGTLRARLVFDAPLNRVAERNLYRESLISYQRARRNYINYIDTVAFTLRNQTSRPATAPGKPRDPTAIARHRHSPRRPHIAGTQRAVHAAGARCGADATEPGARHQLAASPFRLPFDAGQLHQRLLRLRIVATQSSLRARHAEARRRRPLDRRTDGQHQGPVLQRSRQALRHRRSDPSAGRTRLPRRRTQKVVRDRSGGVRDGRQVRRKGSFRRPTQSQNHDGRTHAPSAGRDQAGRIHPGERRPSSRRAHGTPIGGDGETRQ